MEGKGKKGGEWWLCRSEPREIGPGNESNRNLLGRNPALTGLEDIRSNTLSTPINLLTLERGAGCEILESAVTDFDSYELSEEMNISEEIVLISGTLTVSP